MNEPTNQPTEQTKNEHIVVIPAKIVGTGKLKTFELSKKDWSLSRENNDRWLFTEVRV